MSTPVQRRRRVRKRDFVSKDIGKSRVPRRAFERCATIQHLIHQDSKRPPIDCARVTTSFDHFRRDVLFCANERIGPEVAEAHSRVNERDAVGRHKLDTRWCTAVLFRLLGQIKVGQSNVTRLMQQDICDRGGASEEAVFQSVDCLAQDRNRKTAHFLV